MGKKIVCSVVCLTVLLAGGFAQEGNRKAGTVVYAEGNEVSISRGAAVTSYPALSDEILGLVLLEGDIILTEAGTFLEIELYPAGSILRVAENTTFQISKAGGTQELAILYGRVRAKVAKITGTQSFTVRGQNAVAGVRGTDFGYDIIARRGAGDAAPVTNVYCFEGSVEVTPNIGVADVSVENTPAVEPVVINANEMISITPEPAVSPESDATGDPVPQIVKSEIQSIIVSYWAENEFKTDGSVALTEIIPAAGEPVPEPGTEIAAVPQPEDIPGPAADSPEAAKAPQTAMVPGLQREEETPAGKGPTEKQKKLKNESVFTGVSMLAAGALLGSGGLGLHFYQPAGGEDASMKSISNALLTGAGVFIITGAVALIRSFFMPGE